jgi:hypothetical protein
MLSSLKNALTKVAQSDESLVGRKIENDPVIEGLVSDLVDEVMVQNCVLNEN